MIWALFGSSAIAFEHFTSPIRAPAPTMGGGSPPSLGTYSFQAAFGERQSAPSQVRISIFMFLSTYENR